MSLLIHILIILAVAEGLHMRGQAIVNLQAGKDALLNEAYSFDEFVRSFGRTYAVGSEEYSRRAAIFQDSLSQIHAKNSRASRSWTAGVYPFMDWTGAERAERLHGYAPSLARRMVEPAPFVAKTTLFLQLYGGVNDSFEAEAPPVRNQGGLCGSCWAFAAVEAVEARLMKTDSPSQLSVQALLDCVPNPQHCGGTGGCGGANPDQAFDFMRENGVPLEVDLPYTPKEVGKCPLEPYPSGWGRTTLTGWHRLPRNEAQPVMQAIVNDGPVVVAADASDWYPYHYGVFDGCQKDAIPNHSVLAKGYGAEDGKKYWHVQNSWGAQWGEQGSIRLLRHDDEDSWCGNDRRPQEGFACDDTAKQNVTVCGNCGLLIDPVIPQVGRSPAASPAGESFQASFQANQFDYPGAAPSSSAAAGGVAADAASEDGFHMPRASEFASDEANEPTAAPEARQAADSQSTQTRDSFDAWTPKALTAEEAFEAHRVDPPEEETPQTTLAPASDDYDLDLADVLPKEELTEPVTQVVQAGRAEQSKALDPDAEGSLPQGDSSLNAHDHAELTFGSDADSLLPGLETKAQTPMDAYLRR